MHVDISYPTLSTAATAVRTCFSPEHYVAVDYNRSLCADITIVARSPLLEKVLAASKEDP